MHVIPLFPNVLAGAAPAPTGDPDRPDEDRSAPSEAEAGKKKEEQGPVEQQEPVRIRVPPYILTDAEWNKVPKEVQTLLLSWQEETFIGYGAIALSVVCLAMAGVALWLGPAAEDALSPEGIMRTVLGLSGGAAVLLFSASVLLFAFRRWRPKLPMLAPKSSPPQEWEEYEIMDGLRARDAVYLLGSSSIGRRALTATLLMTFAALAIWVAKNLWQP